MEDWVQPTSRGELPRREVMQTPDEVAAMLRLKALGWGVRRIAGELGCSHMTVRRYLAAGGWVAYRGRGRPRTLSGLEEWVAKRFRRHAGNADVVRQELEREKGIRLTLRTVEREVRHLRRELEAEARATIRFETPPGKQLQIDFGERRAVHRFKSRRYWRRAGCQASSEPCPVPIWDDRRTSGQQLPDRSKDRRPGASFLRLPLLGIRPGWPIRQNTKRTKTLIVQCGFHEHFGGMADLLCRAPARHLLLTL
jgi:transposase